FAETIYDLPCQITFEETPYASDIGPLPVQSRGTVTFGCLNRFIKVSPAVLAVWARILKAVPNARLLLKDTALGEQSLRDAVQATMKGHGVSADRIEFRGGTPRIEHLATFNDVDIALDPFPHTGGVGTWEALWGGVPVVTQVGNSPSSRVSAAILAGI